MNSRPCVWGESCIHESTSASASSRICLLEHRIGGRDINNILTEPFGYIDWGALGSLGMSHQVFFCDYAEVRTWQGRKSSTIGSVNRALFRHVCTSYSIMWEIQDFTAAVNIMFLASCLLVKKLSIFKRTLISVSHLDSTASCTCASRRHSVVTFDTMICASKVPKSMKLSLCLSGYSIICSSLEISQSFSGICGENLSSKSEVWIIETRFLASP